MPLSFEHDLPKDVPSSLPIYGLARPSASTAAVAARARQLGFGGKTREFGLSNDWTTYREGPFQLGLHRASGAFSYQHQERYGIEPERPFDLEDERAAAIARAFLETTKLVPLDATREPRITHLRGAVANVDGSERQESVLDAGVVYGRTLDGIPVDGPGAHVMVNIAAEAEVVGCRAVWRQTIERVDDVKIKPLDEAVAVMERVADRMKGHTAVVKAGFGYLEQGPLDRQAYLQPAYWFVYVVRNDGVAHKAIEVVPAGHRVLAPLLGKKRFRSTGQLRRDGNGRAPGA